MGESQLPRTRVILAWDVLVVMTAAVALMLATVQARDLVPVGDAGRAVTRLTLLLAGPTVTLAILGLATAVSAHGQLRCRGRCSGFLSTTAIAAGVITALWLAMVSRNDGDSAALPIGPPFWAGASAFALAAGVLAWLTLITIWRWDASRWVSSLRAVPRGLWIISLFCIGGMLWLPPGANVTLLTRAVLPVVALAALSGVAVRAACAPRGLERVRIFSRPTFSRGDLAFAALPATPVVGYVLGNAGELTLVNMATTVIAFLVVCLVLTVLIPACMSGGVDRRVLMAMLSGVVFVVFAMAAWTDSLTGWLGVQGNRGILVIGPTVLIVVALVMAVISILLPPRVLVVMIVVFVGVQGASAIVSWHQARPQGSPAAADEGGPATQREPWERPLSIIGLLYDGYPNAETLASYRVDNGEQVAFLRNRGFTIYEGTYSLAVPTLPSLSRVLNATDVLARDERDYTSGDANVPRLLREQGYETVGVFPTQYVYSRAALPSWDSYFPAWSLPAVEGRLITEILRGGFVELLTNDVDPADFIDAKRSALSSDGSAPRFVMTYSLAPGQAYHFGAKTGTDATRALGERMGPANSEMRADVDLAIETDPNAVIIVAGDHGPFAESQMNAPTVEFDRLQTQDKYGTFLAIRWPDGVEPRRDITVLQETLPAVLAAVSGDESIWAQREVGRTTLDSPAKVVDGVIMGGPHDGQPLFLESGVRLPMPP